MDQSKYEKHFHEDPDYPFFFHLDPAFSPSSRRRHYHWHESIELLNCVQGDCRAILNGKPLPFRQGDTVIVDPFALHTVVRNDPEKEAMYYCLIVDKSFFTLLGLPAEPHALEPVIRDEEVNRLFSRIAAEKNARSAYWKQAMRADVTTLLIHLCRSFLSTDEKAIRARRSKSTITAEAMKYLYLHFTEEISIDSISRALGFNKYYLCHVFKEITGETIVSYLNLLRCNHARKLLIGGDHTVSEAAEASGFFGLSYFGKTYRRLFGRSPSEDRPEK